MIVLSSVEYYYVFKYNNNPSNDSDYYLLYTLLFSFNEKYYFIYIYNILHIQMFVERFHIFIIIKHGIFCSDVLYIHAKCIT